MDVVFYRVLLNVHEMLLLFIDVVMDVLTILLQLYPNCF